MPIYEYECESCGETFEAIRRFSDPPLESCLECGADNPRKLISAAAFHLKGSGWYATDYGRPKHQPDAKPEKVADAKSEPKASESGDTSSGGGDSSTGGGGDKSEGKNREDKAASA